MSESVERAVGVLKKLQPVRLSRIGGPAGLPPPELRRKAADRAPRCPAVLSADVNVIGFMAGDFGRLPDPARVGQG